MSKSVFYRTLSILVLGVLLSGCSGGREPSRARTSDCAWYRIGCEYEGPYEEGERDYAEREAQRLNQRESSRLSGWLW